MAKVVRMIDLLKTERELRARAKSSKQASAKHAKDFKKTNDKEHEEWANYFTGQASGFTRAANSLKVLRKCMGVDTRAI